MKLTITGPKKSNQERLHFIVNAIDSVLDILNGNADNDDLLLLMDRVE